METKLARLLKRIHDTQTEEIDCSACLEHISEYVDAELDRGDAAKRLPLVEQHLGQCGVCFEEYQLLRDLARMERSGGAPSAQSLIGKLKNPPQ